MISGFDYGTSNCAIGIQTKGTAKIQLLELEPQSPMMPSLLYALKRELICEHVGYALPASEQDTYIRLRGQALSRAQTVRREEGIGARERALYVGTEAFEAYLQSPGEGYFVKSPKSFLGASGLRPEAIGLFEDIVTAMMLAIKARSEALLGEALSKTVIGRPVNFQGLNADKSNQQALSILSTSAKRAGYKQVEFLFEPIAAGLHFERTLKENKTVLVVDIGGGTTDCAMVRMGPDFIASEDRSADFLGHSGERVGGNDLDITLAGTHLMPLLGMRSTLKSGLPVPTQPYWDAVSTNNVSAQSRFNHQETRLLLEQLARDCLEPSLIQRFLKMRASQQQHQVVRVAEKTKIALSSADHCRADLSFIEPDLGEQVGSESYAQAITRPMEKMLNLMAEAITQAACQPELIFITGGSGQSPIIRSAIQSKFGAIPILDGDHFGSVTAGLTVWANKIYR